MASAQLVDIVKNVPGISLAAGILLAVASCTAPAGPAPVATAPDATIPATASAGPEAGPALQTFTFPDGHISFDYPAGWSVRKPNEGPYLKAAGPTKSTKSAEVLVVDETGAAVARVINGLQGGKASAVYAVRRTVLDHAPVPGLPGDAGEPVEFGFALDEIAGVGAYYFMDVRLAHEFLPAQQDSGRNRVSVPTGEMRAYVVFDPRKQPVFATTRLAKTWMATGQYARLKVLLLSLKYS